MEILLLNVSGLALEGIITFSAVYEHTTGNDTHGCAGSEDIEKCGFTGTRNTLLMISKV